MNYAEQYPEIKAAFPGVKLDGGGMSPEQGRLVFHQERLFRSTGTGGAAHRRYLELAAEACLPESIESMDRGQCALALDLIERACRLENMHLFRDTHTGWRELAAV